MSNWGWWSMLLLGGLGFGLISGDWKFILVGAGLGLILGIWLAAKLSRRTEFYEYDDVSPNIIDAIGKADEAWAAWHTASRLGKSGILKRANAGEKLTRVVLLEPNKDGYLKISANSFEKITPQSIVDDITIAIERLKKEGVKEIRTYDGPLLNMVIINPNKKNSWIRITPMAPFLDVGERPGVIIRLNRHRKAYNNLKRAYNDVWEKANDTSDAPFDMRPQALDIIKEKIHAVKE